ncbi:MAG: HAMP domain-containing histidine kinase [Muribaculaceae bacterium]|nr:HAMP domain-containing histidine kinase [Muribaculaceae bacterium]
MKKSVIWLLTIVMSLTFGALLYFQIMYLENMVKMREAQFSETVMRCLSSTSSYLERKETLHFLQEDVNIIESSLYEDNSFTGNSPDENNISYSVESDDGTVTQYTLNAKVDRTRQDPAKKRKSSTVGSLESRYRDMQEVIRSQYLYQQGLLNEVILSILREAGSRPVFERADSTLVRNYLSSELANNGLTVPFEFAISSSKNSILYASKGYDENLEKGIYSQILFPNTDSQLRLNVEFPTKTNYIFSSVRFIIPTLAFTLILLVIFLYTILLAFRQKKLTEMKTDFINNMTHELKTPISTISLAAQMLNDNSVMKSPASLKHLSQVIADESKRLRFQVEKVLQMSVFDNSGSALKFSEVDANKIVENVTHTFKIKVEKYGGSISCVTDAKNAIVNVDEMHFTNIIYNLLDNAVKYMKEDTEPHLSITTRDLDSKTLEIRVSDNGIGIKKEDLKKIFEKFYRVSTGNRHDVKGFGLGLAYVKKMVTIFEGSISAESELGKGSTFIITLPLAN